MADSNPMGDERLVRLDLPERQREILRSKLTDWLIGVLEDLQVPQRLRDPEASRQELEAYERLLVSLTTGLLVIPDEAARGWLTKAVEAHDREGDHAEVTTTHDAMHALLGLLQGGESQ